jgi:hypothetical protein
MSKTEIERFAREIESNAALRVEVRAKRGAVAGVVKIATVYGYSVTADEVRANISVLKPKLIEKELSQMACGQKNMATNK